MTGSVRPYNLLVARRGTLLMELELLREHFGNFSMQGSMRGASGHEVGWSHEVTFWGWWRGMQGRMVTQGGNGHAW